MKQDEFRTEVRRLLDRQQDVRACAGRVLDNWRYDLDSRSFGPAYHDPETGKHRTELDLAVFMAALAERRAVITLPKYKSRRAATATEGEVVVSKENRHGRVSGLTSNKDVFSFNVRIEDANVITTGDVGKPRNFMLQDLDGKWHDGWKVVKFIADTDAEKKLFAKAPEVTFDYFVHPNRWTSIYSRPYLLAKVAILRLADQQKFLKAERRRLRKELNVAPTAWPKSTKVGADKKETFWAFNVDIDGVKFAGDYEAYPASKKSLDEIEMLLRRTNELLEKLRFHTRASEFAFWKYGVLKSMPVDSVSGYLSGIITTGLRQPNWATGEWQTGYKETPRARTFWARLERDEGLVLRWRAWKKTERVAA